MRGPTVLVCEYPTLNGGERSLLAVLDELSSAHFAVVAPRHGPLADALQRRGLAHAPFEFRDPTTGTRLPLEKLQIQLAGCLQRLNPAHVHANSLAMSRLTGSIATTLPCPVTGHIRDILRVSRAAVRDLNGNAQLVAVSQATRRFHIHQGVEASRIRVIYNGVETQRFTPRPACGLLRQELGVKPNTPLIANVGQISLRKGQDILLRAVLQLAEQPAAGCGHDCHAVMLGARHSDKQESRDFEARLQTLSRHPALAGRVHWLGIRDDTPAIFNEASLLVHTAHQEPLGRVLLEAAASGLPIVATDVGGTAEILQSDQSAVLVPPGDVPATAAAIARLLQSPELAARLGARARLRVVDRFSIARCAGQLANLWQLSGI